MLGIDEQIAGLNGGDALLVVLAVAFLLGLRHATDPDHLTAVSTLIASDDGGGSRRAGVLGMAWGLGHASTLFAIGLPFLLFDSRLPDAVRNAAEVAIGLVIVLLAARVLWRWRRGQFHAHPHRHGPIEHRHLHAHEHGARHAQHHACNSVLGRSPLQSFAIGLVHGVGGSAGVGVLLLAATADRTLGIIALATFALGTALSMWALSCALGYLLTRGPAIGRLVAIAPALGVASLLFGAWYALGALQAVPYPL